MGSTASSLASAAVGGDCCRARRRAPAAVAAQRFSSTSATEPAVDERLFFDVPASAITPLLRPADFYAELLAGARRASTRVTLASLYLGTGQLEQELVAALAERAQAVARESGGARALQIAVQLDLSRAMRHVHVPTHSGGASQPHHHGYTSSVNLLQALLASCPPQPQQQQQQQQCGASVHVGLTLMPQLRGLVGRLLPARWVEGGGVFHAKAYVFDDDVLLSGANLSHDYFTHRQDRYVLLRGVPAFAAYLHRLVDGLRGLPGGHVLRPDGAVVANGWDGASSDLPSGTASTAAAAATSESGPLLGSSGATPSSASGGSDSGPGRGAGLLTPSSALPPLRYTPLADGALHAHYSRCLAELLWRHSGGKRASSGSGGFSPDQPDVTSGGPPLAAGHARLFPRLQLGHLGVDADERDTLALLRSIGPAPEVAAGTTTSSGDSGSHVDVAHLATGYFNLTARYSAALLRGCHPASSVHILTASPRANGFWGAVGVSGAIPAAYSEIERRFYAAAASAGRLHPAPLASPAAPGIALYEYDRPGWTFHGKGLWLQRQQSATRPTGAAQPPDVVITLVGSPNFGRRSSERDLELQVEVRTSEPGLAGRLLAERDALFGRLPVADAAPQLLPRLNVPDANAAADGVDEAVVLAEDAPLSPDDGGSSSGGGGSPVGSWPLPSPQAVEVRHHQQHRSFLGDGDAAAGLHRAQPSSAPPAVAVATAGGAAGGPGTSWFDHYGDADGAPAGSGGRGSASARGVLLRQRHGAATGEAPAAAASSSAAAAAPNAAAPPAAAPRPTVAPVGAHIGADVWAAPDRRLQGWSWRQGLWIALGWRLLAPFF